MDDFNIMDILDKVNADDLAMVLDQEKQLRCRLTCLQNWRHLIEIRLGRQSKGRRKSTPPDKKPGNGEANGQENGMDKPAPTRQLAVARYLLAHGPSFQKNIADACNFPQGSMYKIIEGHPYFEKFSDGKINLTNDGRRAAGGNS